VSLFAAPGLPFLLAGRALYGLGIGLAMHAAPGGHRCAPQSFRTFYLSCALCPRQTASRALPVLPVSLLLVGPKAHDSSRSLR
jgi:hypothetical protein